MTTETSKGLEYYCNHLEDAVYAYLLKNIYRIASNGI